MPDRHFSPDIPLELAATSAFSRQSRISTITFPPQFSRRGDAELRMHVLLPNIGITSSDASVDKGGKPRTIAPIVFIQKLKAIAACYRAALDKVIHP